MDASKRHRSLDRLDHLLRHRLGVPPRPLTKEQEEGLRQIQDPVLRHTQRLMEQYVHPGAWPDYYCPAAELESHILPLEELLLVPENQFGELYWFYNDQGCWGPYLARDEKGKYVALCWDRGIGVWAPRISFEDFLWGVILYGLLDGGYLIHSLQYSSKQLKLHPGALDNLYNTWEVIWSVPEFHVRDHPSYVLACPNNNVVLVKMSGYTQNRLFYREESALKSHDHLWEVGVWERLPSTEFNDPYLACWFSIEERENSL